MKRLYIYILLPACLHAAASRAQESVAAAIAADSVMHRNSEFVSGEDPWLTIANAAALTRYHRDNLSWATLHADYGHGGFVDYNQSSRDLNFSADVRSFYRMTDKAVAYGRISYENQGLHNMTGSAFISPEHYPFNIVEDSLTNPGKIHQDIYHLTGGIGIDVWKGYSLGAKVDFTAANAAKYKDLRHKNKLMDIDATFGVYLPVLSWLSLGVNYQYLRHSESVTFSTYARTDVTYISLIEYGGMIGMVEQFGNDGMTASNKEIPLFFDGHGFDAQAELRLSSKITWFNSFGMAYQKGYYGNDNPYNIVYMRHSTHQWHWRTRLQYRNGNSLHHLDAGIDNEKLRNYQSQYRLTANDHGARYYEYFQPLKTADKVWVNTHIGYTGLFGLKGETPTWQVEGGCNLAYRKQTAYLYPYYRRQHWESTEGYINGKRNIFLRSGILTVGAGFSYKKGSGSAYQDGSFVAPSDKQTAPADMTAFLWREYAYNMAPQYEFSANAQYAFIMPGTQLKSYVRLDYAYCHANYRNDFMQGKTHWRLGGTIGINF